MQSSEHSELALFLSEALSYWRADLSRFSLTVWQQACEPFSLEQVRKAFTAHATDPQRGMFAPKVADIVRVLQGTHGDRSLIAWGKTLQAMSGVGAWRDVVFDDPVIHAVVHDLGGWIKLCRTHTSELGFVQHRFCQSYQAYAAQQDLSYPAVLAGECATAADYQRFGLPAPEPMAIGDPHKARLVHARGSCGASHLVFPLHFVQPTDRKESFDAHADANEPAHTRRAS